MKKSNNSPDITKLSFEEALEQLEEIVSKLEDGSINLEESIAEYVSLIFSNVESFAHKAPVAFNCRFKI